MKKLKPALIAAAVAVGIGGAITTRLLADPFRYDSVQYYKADTYKPAGTWGVDYDCNTNESATCTWYEWDPEHHPGEYAPGRPGDFIIIK